MILLHLSMNDQSENLNRRRLKKVKNRIRLKVMLNQYITSQSDIKINHIIHQRFPELLANEIKTHYYATDSIKFTPKQKFKFFCEVLKSQGVIIHKSAHYFYGDKHPDWPEGYFLELLLKVTYKNKTGWIYNRFSSCPCCYPDANFNGYFKYGSYYEYNPYNPYKNLSIDEKNVLANEYANLCEHIGIPSNDLTEFVTEYFTLNNERFCDLCSEDIEEGYYYCQICTALQKNIVVDICQACALTRRHSLHELEKQFFTDTYAECYQCFETLKNLKYHCKECTAHYNYDKDTIDLCIKCVEKHQIEFENSSIPNHKITHKLEYKSTKIVDIPDSQTIIHKLNSEIFSAMSYNKTEHKSRISRLKKFIEFINLNDV